MVKQMLRIWALRKGNAQVANTKSQMVTSYTIRERKCAMVTQETTNPRQMTLQVSDVHKGLLSVVELDKKGQRVVFDSNWSYIQDKSTGSCDSLVQTDDAFELVTLVKPINQVKSEDFDRPGR